jgi:hypothetical protein
VRHSLGLKAPRGYGWLTNPRRAAYNRIYNRTSRGCLVSLVILILLFSGVIAQISFRLAVITVHVRAYYRKDGTYQSGGGKPLPLNQSLQFSSPGEFPTPSSATDDEIHWCRNTGLLSQRPLPELIRYKEREAASDVGAIKLANRLRTRVSRQSGRMGAVDGCGGEAITRNDSAS